MIDFLNPPIEVGTVENFKANVRALYKERGKVLNLNKILAPIKTLDDLELYIQSLMVQDFKLQISKKNKLFSIAECNLGNVRIVCRKNIGAITKKGEFSTNYGGRVFSVQNTHFYTLKNGSDFDFYLTHYANAIPSFRQYTYKEFCDCLKVNLVQNHTLNETQESHGIFDKVEEFMGEMEGVRFYHRTTVFNGIVTELTHLSSPTNT